MIWSSLRPGGSPALRTHCLLLSSQGPLGSHRPAAVHCDPTPSTISYLVRTVQPSIPEVIAAMEVRLPANMKVGAWGSCPVREAGSWVGLPLGTARAGTAAQPSGALPPPTDLPRSASQLPSGSQGAFSPGGTSVRGLHWTLTLFSAWHWNQSDVWVSGNEKLAGCPWFGLCCMCTCPSFLTRL